MIKAKLPNTYRYVLKTYAFQYYENAGTETGNSKAAGCRTNRS